MNSSMMMLQSLINMENIFSLIKKPPCSVVHLLHSHHLLKQMKCLYIHLHLFLFILDGSELFGVILKNRGNIIHHKLIFKASLIHKSFSLLTGAGEHSVVVR